MIAVVKKINKKQKREADIQPAINHLSSALEGAEAREKGVRMLLRPEEGDDNSQPLRGLVGALAYQIYPRNPR